MARSLSICSRLSLLLVIAILAGDTMLLTAAAKSPPGKALTNKSPSPKRTTPSSPRPAPKRSPTSKQPTPPKAKQPASPAKRKTSPPKSTVKGKPVRKSPAKPPRKTLPLRKSPPKSLPRKSPPRKSPHRKSPPRKSPLRKSPPRKSPAKLTKSPPRKSPTKKPSPSPKVISSEDNYSPVAAKLPCYPGPYTKCSVPLPGGPPLQRAPSSNVNQFANQLSTAQLLPPGTYTTFIINANEGYYLSGTYVFESLIVNGYLTCGQPGAPQTDIDITATYIAVAGVFHCGKADNPYNSKVTITMRGSGTGDGQKHIAVTGWMMMVGTARKAWTQIADTVPAGATSFTTKEPVDWLPGERIVMASTSFNPNHTEEAVIASVSQTGTGTTVTVTTPFQFAHWGTIQSYPSSKGAVQELDERAEVGLLERNIVIQGDEASTVDGQGAFLTIFQAGSGWFRDVKFFRAGQLGKMGRYPVHWHLVGDREGNHITNSVIFKSWNRCMSVHATNFVRVVGTVCYDHIGHGFMVEDSCEHSNIFRNNLGIRTRLPATKEAGLLDTDTTHLSTFWITNTLNHFVGNVATSSDFAGFWIMLPTRPIHLCASNGFFPDMNVQTLSMGRFDDNVGHSNNVGLGIEGGICDTARAEKCSGIYMPADVPQVNRLRSYKCTNSFRTAWVTVDKLIRFDSCVFGDNGGSILLSGSQIMYNSLIVGQSANTLQDTTPPARVGFGLYDGPSGLVNSHFAGFEKTGFRCFLPVTSAFKRWNAFIQGITFASDIPATNKFVQSVNRTLSEMHMQGLVDLDGSLTGTPGTTLMAAPAGINNTLLPVGRQDSDFNVPADTSCTWNTVWRIWLCQGVTWGSIRINHFFAPNSRARVVDVIRSDGKQATIDANIRIWYQFNVILNRGLSYRVVYRDSHALGDTGDNPRPFDVELHGVDPGTTTQLTLENLPAGRVWTAFDCARRVAVVTNQPGTSVALTLTAAGAPSREFPNLRFGSAKVRVCMGPAATCSC